MSPNKEVLKFLIVLPFIGDFFSIHMKHATNNFIRLLNFTYCFVKVNVDVSYDDNRNLSEPLNKSEPGSNGSNKNAFLVFPFLTSSFFHLLIKQKPDGRVKIILLAFFLFLGSYVRHIQHATPYH